MRDLNHQVMTGRSAQLIRQTLDGVVTAKVRDALLAGALRSSALGKIPEDPEAFASFVGGPLRGALVRGLGPELAASVLEEIRRASEVDEELRPPSSGSARRSQRSKSPPPRRNTPPHRVNSARRTPSTPPSSRSGRAGTQPPHSGATRAPTQPPYSGPISRRGAPWGSDEYPASGMLGLDDRPTSEPQAASPARVLVLSSDEALLRRIQPWLEGRAELAQITSMRELLRDLDAIGEGRIALLVDCRRPSIQPTAIAALAEELPPNVNVILLSPNADQQRRLRTVSDAVNRFIVMRGEMQPREIAERCATLVG